MFAREILSLTRLSREDCKLGGGSGQLIGKLRGRGAGGESLKKVQLMVRLFVCRERLTGEEEGT